MIKYTIDIVVYPLTVLFIRKRKTERERRKGKQRERTEKGKEIVGD